VALPGNAEVVVVRGFWWDEATQSGVRQASGQPATVTFTPVPLDGQPVTDTPNLRDLAVSGFLKTRSRIAVVDRATGYFATQLVASNDPDLDAYAGRLVTFLGEPSFTVEVPYNAPTVTVDAAMAAAVGLLPGSSVKAVWLSDAALVATPPPPAPINYLSSSETLSNIASGIDAHDGDPTSHADIRAQMVTNAATAHSELTAHTTNTSNPHAVTKAQVGLGSADNTSDVNKPVSTAQSTALGLKMDKTANLADVVNATTARSNLGLGNVDNTSDANKPVSTAQAAADALKLAKASNLSDLASVATAKTNLSLVKGDVGLGNVDNTSDASKPLSTAATTALAGKANTSHTHTVTDLATTTGTASSSTFLRGDNTWAKPRGTTATNGDVAATLTPGTSATTQVWNTALTAARAVTLAAGTDGDHFRVVRTATATGAFNLNVGTGPLKALTAASTWVDVTCVGTTWMVTAAGSL
jgi:hypothetical protein